MALAFVDFPLPNHGMPAVLGSEAAHCAGEQDRYWEMHDAIFENQDQLTPLIEAEEPPIVDVLVSVGEGIGLDTGALRTCLEEQRYRPIVGGLFQEARETGINVTPTILVGDEPVEGFLPYADFRPIVERQLAKALGTPVAETPEAGATLGP